VRHYADVLFDTERWPDQCASGDDGIYHLEPDKSKDDDFDKRMDFAGKKPEAKEGGAVVRKWVKFGHYPLGAIMINTFYNPHGDTGYSELTDPKTDKFCSQIGGKGKYKDYCVVTRVNDEHHDKWEAFTGQILSKPEEICRASGKMAYLDPSKGWQHMYFKDGKTHNEHLQVYHVWSRLVSKSCDDIKAEHKKDQALIYGEVEIPADLEVIDGKMGNQSESSATRLRR